MDVSEQHEGQTGEAPEQDQGVAVLQEVGRDRRAAHRRDEVQRHLVRDRVQHHLPMSGGWRRRWRWPAFWRFGVRVLGLGLGYGFGRVSAAAPRTCRSCPC